MHDFIDGTNPGKNRMRKSRSAFYFEELRRAKQLLDQGTHESIEELFKGEINPRMASINWARDNLVPYSRRF